VDVNGFGEAAERLQRTPGALGQQSKVFGQHRSLLGLLEVPGEFHDFGAVEKSRPAGKQLPAR